MKNKISIIGAGTYGSYLANAISEKYPLSEIHLFDLGNSSIQSEKEAGLVSRVQAGLYKATSDGRFFGLGGTSAKWGGQLLFFSEKDFKNDTGMRSIIEFNKIYKTKVLSRFFEHAPVLDERNFNEQLFIKQGIWLKFSQRNMFNHFKLAQNKNIFLHQNVRITKLNKADNKIFSISLVSNDTGEISTFEAGEFYLTTGAFESIRLMHASGLLNIEESSAGFSDHVSLRCFEVNSSNTKVGSQDFQFRFINGSMITSRLVGEIDDVSFYIHPVFNERFMFFQFLKQLIFKGKFSPKILMSAISQFFALFPFVYSYFIKKKLFVYKSWYLHIDIELSNSKNSVQISEELDVNKQNGIDIDYQISEETIEKLKQVRNILEDILKKEKINYSEVADRSASSLKLEDTYHPYKLFSVGNKKDILDLYNPVSNLYLVNTGLLERSGGINPTAALFCLIEHHVEKMISY